MSLIDTSWLEKNIDKVKIIDCSWHMPQTQRSGFEEYIEEHIPNAIFFDLDKNSKLDTDLPHMLTDSKSWEKIMSNMGIENNDRIVIYDNSDVISSCRCWYNLIYYGHDPQLVHVLDGGLKKWKKENKSTDNKEVITQTSKYTCKENKELVKNKKQIVENIDTEKFNSFKFDHDKDLVFSCGSGVTASVLALAYSLINAKYMPTIYDGSWAEYGKN